ncbi:LPXTG cell wall anchor domain-containing protein [Streptomyces sp. JHA26]|uniref:LPXTG cell wall anchor domain-containing protein n=1 Tax=Streptomyces sp. JHA26 TaxID=1917143 RepID=UPI00209AF329|nr:LPXTG cell wall anchor domain-containing protein [Streptomyces sp. JHA26]
MASTERRDGRPERRWQDGLWVIGLFALAVGFLTRMAFGGASGWLSALVGAALMSLYTVWLVRRRRRHDARTTGACPDDVPAMERRILKGAPPPEDPGRRRAMAALVDSRQQRLRRHRWWSLPLLAVLFFGTAGLWFASGERVAGGWMLAVAVVFMTWMVWYHFRYDRRLSQMRRRLQG